MKPPANIRARPFVEEGRYEHWSYDYDFETGERRRKRKYIVEEINSDGAVVGHYFEWRSE